MNSDRPHDESFDDGELPDVDGECGESYEPTDLVADANSEEVAECIRFIEKVRHENPDCLAGLAGSSSGPPDALSSSTEFLLSSAADFPFKIGRFRILRKLGEGGFGIVFLALDSDLDRQVALKLPRVEALLTDETRRRFLHEGKAAARLNHRNIGTVHEAGQMGPLCYIVSSYCAGGSLLDLIRSVSARPRGRGEAVAPSIGLSYQAVASLVLALAEAVQHAHDRGILHRDLKPSNVMFDVESDSDEPSGNDAPIVNLADRCGESSLADAARIVDFGLAKSLHEDDERTQTGATLGTPNYMSPEQAKGEKASIGPTTDVYSLGAILYELLTSRPPFKEPSHVETVIAVKNNDPVLPRRINSDCPRDLEAVCLKCLEKVPNHRYSTASALADDLHRYLRCEPVLARTPSALVRCGRWCRRHPLAAVLTCLLATLAIVGPLIALNQSRLYQAAESARQDVRGTLYMSDMNLALRDWDEANIERCGELLRRHLPQPGQRDHRGFEWYYLWRQWREANQTPVVLHDDQLESIALSPDEKLLAVGRHDGMLCVWDQQGGRILHQWQAHPYRTHSLAFSANGQVLASASIDNEVKLWDVATYRELTTLTGERVVACSPVDGTVAYRTNARAIAILDPGESTPRLISEAHDIGVGCLSFSPDGQSLVSGGWEATVRVWNVESGTLQTEMGRQEYSMWSIRWSPNGKYVVSGDVYGRLHIWDAVAGQPMKSMDGHRTTVTSLAFSPDSTMLASASEDNTVKLWEMPAGKELKTLRGHFGEVKTVQFAKQGQRLLTASIDGRVKSWNVSELASADILEHPDAVSAAAFSDDGQLIITSCHDGRLRFWEAATGKLQKAIDAHDGGVWLVRFLKYGGQAALVSVGRDGKARLWDLDSGAFLHEFDARPNSTDVVPLAVSDDSHLLAFSDSGYTVQVWDLKRNRLVNRLTVGGAYDLSFLSGGHTLAVASMRSVSLWDVVTAQKQFSVPVDSRMARCLALSPDGQTIATGSYDRTVKLWDVGNTGSGPADSRPRLVMRGPAAQVETVAYAPDGSVLASAGDQVIRLWDPQTGEQRGALAGHSHSIGFLVFSPDSKTLVSVSGDQTARIWRATMSSGAAR